MSAYSSLSRVVRKFGIHIVNIICKILPPDPVSNRFRPILLRSIGYRVGPRTSICPPDYLHGGAIEIGGGCFINLGAYFDLSGKVTIGNRVHFGHHVTVVTTEHAMGGPERRCGPITTAPVVIGDGAWIGANALILPGVTIGKGAVVAAGAVVSKSVPDNALAGGVPARVLRWLDQNEPSPSAD